MNHTQLSQSFNPKNQLSQTLPSSASSFQTPIKIQSFQGNHDQALSFYNQEIAKLLYTNTIITAQLSSAFQEKKILLELISSAEKRQATDNQAQKQKRFRRCAKEIQRKYQCPSKQCGKSYGSEGSLAQHIRLKHPNSKSHEPPLLLEDPC